MYITNPWKTAPKRKEDGRERKTNNKKQGYLKSELEHLNIFHICTDKNYSWTVVKSKRFFSLKLVNGIQLITNKTRKKKYL